MTLKAHPRSRCDLNPCRHNTSHTREPAPTFIISLADCLTLGSESDTIRNIIGPIVLRNGDRRVLARRSVRSGGFMRMRDVQFTIGVGYVR